MSRSSVTGKNHTGERRPAPIPVDPTTATEDAQLEALEFSRGLTPVQIAISKARAMAWVLEQLGNADETELQAAIADGPGETLGWLQSVVAKALRDALDAAEAAHRIVRAKAVA